LPLVSLMSLDTVAVGLPAWPAAAATLPSWPAAPLVAAALILSNREDGSLSRGRRRALGARQGGAYEWTPYRVDPQLHG